MNRTIDIPPFPPLTWNRYSWSGEVRLPSWVGFQSRRGAYASVSDPAASDGTAGLTVEGDAESLPTPEQAAAFRYLLEHESAVAAAVLRAIFEYYPAEREAKDVPEIADPAGLRALVGLSAVHVTWVVQDGAACIGFEFGCAWDAEHGAGVMTHLGWVIATGQADSSFVAWIAREVLGQ